MKSDFRGEHQQEHLDWTCSNVVLDGPGFKKVKRWGLKIHYTNVLKLQPFFLFLCLYWKIIIVYAEVQEK